MAQELHFFILFINHSYEKLQGHMIRLETGPLGVEWG